MTTEGIRTVKWYETSNGCYFTLEDAEYVPISFHQIYSEEELENDPSKEET